MVGMFEEVGKAGSPCMGSLAYRPDRDLADLSNSTPSRHVTNIDGDVVAKLDALGIENELSTANSVLQLLQFLSSGERQPYHLKILMLHPFRSIRFRVAHCVQLRALSLFYNLAPPLSLPIMAKRKRSAVAASPATAELSSLERSKITNTEVPLPSNVATNARKPTRRQSSRAGKTASTNPNTNPDVLDGVSALRASPDCAPESHLAPDMSNDVVNGDATQTNNQVEPSGTPAVNGAPTVKGRGKKASTTQVKLEPQESKAAVEAPAFPDDAAEAEGLEEDEAEVKEALARPPPVNSDYLPLPWKGRLGYVCMPHDMRSPSLTRSPGMSKHISSQREPSGVQL